MRDFDAFGSGRMAEVWEIPFDQAENDRCSGVRAATLARPLTTVDPDRPRPPSWTPHRWASPGTVRWGQDWMA